MLALELPTTVGDLVLTMNGPERRAQFLYATVADLPFIAAYTVQAHVLGGDHAAAIRNNRG